MVPLPRHRFSFLIMSAFNRDNSFAQTEFLTQTKRTPSLHCVALEALAAAFPTTSGQRSTARALRACLMMPMRLRL